MVKKKQNKSTQPGTANPAVAVVGADGMLEVAMATWHRVPKDAAQAAVYARANIGELLASSTNLVLAIELYMKALALLYGRAAPHLHDLPELFACLGAEQQEAVLSAYDDLAELHPIGSFMFELNPEHAPFVNRAKWDRSLLPLLQRNRNAYESWRYAFTSFEGPTARGFAFELGALLLAAHALRRQFGPVRLLDGSQVEFAQLLGPTTLDKDGLIVRQAAAQGL